MSTKVNLTNREYLQLYKGLDSVKEIKGARFAVLVGRNIKELKNVLEPLESAAAPTVEFQQLSVQMQELINNEDQKAIEALEETNEVHVHMLREDQLPEGITGEQVSNILQILT